MLKRLSVAFAAVFVLATNAHAAGVVPGFSLTPQYDLTGKLALGCKLYVFQAGTTSTPQTAYQDSGLTIPSPGGNVLSCDAIARLPQFFVADGSIKLVLRDVNGALIFSQDGLLVVGPSGGSSGGASVDPTTILATGDLKVSYGTGVVTGFVRANGRTIGSATSGATERANSDTQALFLYLWGADANLTVSGGRGASAAADWAANKTIALPDWRGRALAGLDDMGNSAAGRLTSTYFGTAATVLGAAAGSESSPSLLQANLPNVNFGVSGTVTVFASGSPGAAVVQGSAVKGTASGTAFNTFENTTFAALTASLTAANAASGGAGTPFRVVQPTMLATIYLKL